MPEIMRPTPRFVALPSLPSRGSAAACSQNCSASQILPGTDDGVELTVRHRELGATPVKVSQARRPRHLRPSNASAQSSLLGSWPLSSTRDRASRSSSLWSRNRDPRCACRAAGRASEFVGAGGGNHRAPSAMPCRASQVCGIRIRRMPRRIVLRRGVGVRPGKWPTFVTLDEGGPHDVHGVELDAERVNRDRHDLPSDMLDYVEPTGKRESWGFGVGHDVN